MKRFLFLFLFFTSCTFAFGQNLIPNPSAENYIECPTGLGIMETWVSDWQSFRGTTDYFNNCSDGLGSNNPFGYQEPRTGDAYLSLYTFRRNPINQREYFGIQLLEVLDLGQTYYVSFYVSRAHKSNAFNLASNNIGTLLMTDNFLNNDANGSIPNLSTFHVESIIEDTINWVNISYQFIADSAYQYLAFGNFFENDLTDTLRIGGEPDGNVTSYYYFDDFCLSLNPNECDIVNSTKELNAEQILMWPIPSRNEVNITAPLPIQEVSIYNVQGQIIANKITNRKETVNIPLQLQPGMYIAIIQTEKGIFKKRFVVSN